MADKNYIITLSEELENITGVDVLSTHSESPMKAVIKAFDSIGYKVFVSRKHSYSIDPSSDVMVKYDAPTGYNCYYKIYRMIKIKK